MTCFKREHIREENITRFEKLQLVGFFYVKEFAGKKKRFELGVTAIHLGDPEDATLYGWSIFDRKTNSAWEGPYWWTTFGEARDAAEVELVEARCGTLVDQGPCNCAE